MFKEILYKSGYTLLTLWGVITVIFCLFFILPGDPARMMLDQREDKMQLKIVRQKLGLDLPIFAQYAYYLNDLSPISLHNTTTPNSIDYYSTSKYNSIVLFETDTSKTIIKTPYLRESFQNQGKKVSSILKEVLPNTILLAFCSITIAFILGVLLGVFSALTQNSSFDRIIAIITSIGMSIPSFFSAILMAWIFAFVLREYTGLNMTGSLYEIDDMGEGRHLTLKNLILPSLTLGIRPLAVITQLMRNSLLEVLNQDYIRTAKAKGLSTFTIIRKHALKNALNPVITAISGWFASMLAGAVFVEYIFGWNGLGKEIVDALNNLDLPVIMGAVLIIAFMFIFINIIVDLLYKLLDPRVR
ncbi:MAG: ABC transporter permease [Flavobacteriales bacterium]